MKTSLTAAVAALLLAACSTTVKEAGGPGASPGPAVSVQSVRGAAAVPVPGDLVARLSDAIRSQVAARASSGTQVTLEFNVVEYRERSATARALGGMLVGADHLRAAVTLRDAGGGVVRQFEVNRVSNPGGIGALRDQEQALIEAAARAVADAVGR